MVEADRTGTVATVWRGAQRAWQWGRRHRFRMADWCYAAFLFMWLAMNLPVGWGAGPGLLPDSLTPQPTDASLWSWETFLALLLVVPVLFRRSRPTLLLVTALTSTVVLGVPLMSALALYSYAVWFGNRKVLAAWSSAVVLGICVSYTLTPFWATFIMLVLIVGFPLTFGLWVGTRRALIANLQERAARLERERDLEARHAIAAERTRIAREMHDVVAHRVSLIVLHAGGLEVSAADETTERTASLIRGTGREALSELREILGVLRDETHTDPSSDTPTTTETTAPQPKVSDLPRLVAEWRSTGVSVDWRTRGNERPLGTRVERTVYRVVQEALTNATKHAPGAHVIASLEYGEADVRVVVTNDRPRRGATPPGDQPSGGHGLSGLRERVGLAGGNLVTGPRPDGGWRVRATVPAAAEPDETGDPSADRGDNQDDDEGTGAEAR